MGASGRLALFLGIVLSVWTLFHLYAFQRAFSIPAMARALPWAARVGVFAVLWLSYPVGRVLARSAPGALARRVELFGAIWMGVLFLTFASLLAADVVTGFGKLWPRGAVPARSAALAVAGVLSVIVHLSHSPLLGREAASPGARLMLSGHTHGGQLWPFSFLSAIPYPFQAGRFEVGGMTLVVSRGTGTWGPPMRRFYRSQIGEIMLLT